MSIHHVNSPKRAALEVTKAIPLLLALIKKPRTIMPAVANSVPTPMLCKVQNTNILNSMLTVLPPKKFRKVLNGLVCS